MAVDQKYIDQATSQLTPTHNSQVTSLKNQLAQNQLALDQQKNSVNANYDLNVQNQNLNNRLNKNTVSNAMLGRGLANSSIAISGLAEQDAKNARVQADIERNRVNDLGNIDANKALLEQNTNNTIGQMDRDLQDKILALAMQLEDRQWEKDFKDKGYQLQLDQFNYDKLYKDQQLQFSKDQFEYDKLYKDQQLQMQQQAQAYDQQYKDKLFEQSQQAQMFDQQYKNQTLELQKQAQAYEQQYKDITLKMEQEKMKFDMGYQNEYLAMQKEAQQAPPSGGGTGGSTGPVFSPDSIVLQVGIGSDEYSQIGFSTKFSLTGIEEFRNIGVDMSTDFLSMIDEKLSVVSGKQTELGAVSNRLGSVLEEIFTKYGNLVSSRSTLRDADIAEISSQYIQQQILQQAAATLMSTANQSPSIALQLI